MGPSNATEVEKIECPTADTQHRRWIDRTVEPGGLRLVADVAGVLEGAERGVRCRPLIGYVMCFSDTYLLLSPSEKGLGRPIGR